MANEKNNALVRSVGNTDLLKSLERTTSLTSLKDLVRTKDAERVCMLLDCSISMNDRVLKAGKARHECLRQVVAQVKAQQDVPMIAFGPVYKDGRPATREEMWEMPESDKMAAMGWSVAGFVSEVPEPSGGTPLAEAIDFARANGLSRIVLISDGYPNNPSMAEEAAKRFGGRIDVVFIGDDGDRGQVFLESLARMTGGEKFDGDLGEIKRLTGTVVALLSGEVEIVEGDDDEDDDEEDDIDDEDDEDDDE